MWHKFPLFFVFSPAWTRETNNMANYAHPSAQARFNTWTSLSKMCVEKIIQKYSVLSLVGRGRISRGREGRAHVNDNPHPPSPRVVSCQWTAVGHASELWVLSFLKSLKISPSSWIKPASLFPSRDSRNTRDVNETLRQKKRRGPRVFMYFQLQILRSGN